MCHFGFCRVLSFWRFCAVLADGSGVVFELRRSFLLSKHAMAARLDERSALLEVVDGTWTLKVGPHCCQRAELERLAGPGKLVWLQRAGNEHFSSDRTTPLNAALDHLPASADWVI